MGRNSTALLMSFEYDTHRGNEEYGETSLKYRMASENTAQEYIEKEEVVTNYIIPPAQYKLTSQFRERVLNRQYVIPNVIDDIKQKFSGVVIDIDRENEEIIARISDITNPNNPEEQVTLGFDEILESDLSQLAKGDSFVWYIGYIQGMMVSRQNFSKIRFRRLPKWSQQEIDTANDNAEKLSQFFSRDPDTRA
ncbi:MAG: hypothetical protein JXA04_11370 [Gammaproteobacteria bacterium]|nr:hypothetical protein [Gammaproteobacteria bacterium]